MIEKWTIEDWIGVLADKCYQLQDRIAVLEARLANLEEDK